MALYKYSRPSTSGLTPVGITEFEILKATHKFLRDDEEQASSWNEQLAVKYYDNLYREFAVCDLKHFKSGNFALRWRTEEEVLNGIGETTCGNSRCEYHNGPSRYQEVEPQKLTTLELPFSYVEHGEGKSALVKVVLCGGCVRKLMWKRRKEKGKVPHVEQEVAAVGADSGVLDEDGANEDGVNEDSHTLPRGLKMKKRQRAPRGDGDGSKERQRRGRERNDEAVDNRSRSHRKRSSRSRSPRTKPEDGDERPWPR